MCALHGSLHDMRPGEDHAFARETNGTFPSLNRRYMTYPRISNMCHSIVYTEIAS